MIFRLTSRQLLVMTVLTFLVSGIPGPLGSQELKVGWNAGLEAPYLTLSAGRVTGGILYDLAAEVGRKAGYKVSFVEVPRRRNDEAVADGKVNILFTNPTWTTDPEKYAWSEVLFTAEYAVLTRKDFRPLAKTEDLKGMVLGTIFGYVYPDLEELLKTGNLKREDVASMSQNISKLLAGRIDGVFGDRILLQWLSRYQKQYLTLQPLAVGIYPVSLAVAKNSGLDIQRILQACRALHNDRSPDKILQGYR